MNAPSDLCNRVRSMHERTKSAIETIKLHSKILENWTKMDFLLNVIGIVDVIIFNYNTCCREYAIH